MTVDPRLQLTPGEYLIHPDGSASKVVDRHAMTVDEIIATGEYTDRRGRIYRFDTKHLTWMGPQFIRGKPFGLEPLRIHEMRLLIERDMHRDVCVGLAECESHPVPHVTVEAFRFENTPVCFNVFHGGPISFIPKHYNTMTAAMGAARALAVGE